MAVAPKRRTLKGDDRRGDTRRTSASEAGYNNEWSKEHGTAAQARERDKWLCCECVRIGGEAWATIQSIERRNRVRIRKDGEPQEMHVDHILPAHIVGPARFHDLDNLQTLCELHHSQKTKDDVRKYGSGRG